MSEEQTQRSLPQVDVGTEVERKHPSSFLPASASGAMAYTPRPDLDYAAERPTSSTAKVLKMAAGTVAAGLLAGSLIFLARQGSVSRYFSGAFLPAFISQANPSKQTQAASAPLDHPLIDPSREDRVSQPRFDYDVQVPDPASSWPQAQQASTSGGMPDMNSRLNVVQTHSQTRAAVLPIHLSFNGVSLQDGAIGASATVPAYPPNLLQASLSVAAYNDDPQFTRIVRCSMDGNIADMNAIGVSPGQYTGSGVIMPKQSASFQWSLAEILTRSGISFFDIFRRPGTHTLSCWVTSYRQYGPASAVNVNLNAQLSE